MDFDPNKPFTVVSDKVSFDPDQPFTVVGEPEGGLIAAGMQTVGSTIKGVGQVAADYIPGVDQENALKKYGQEIIDENPTAVKDFGDIAEKPWTAVKEAIGNSVPSMGGMLGARALGQGITAISPAAGVAAPIVAGVGQIISWLGPAAIAGLPSYSGIRDKQILNDPANQESSKAKAIAAMGAAAVGAIEEKFGPQDWAMAMLTKEGRTALAKKFTATTLGGKVLQMAGTGALVEGAEEIAQNPIEQLASFDNPLTPENLKDTAFSGAMGAIGGGLIGGGMAFVQPKVEPPPSVTNASSVDEAISAANAELETPDIPPNDGENQTIHGGNQTNDGGSQTLNAAPLINQAPVEPSPVVAPAPVGELPEDFGEPPKEPVKPIDINANIPEELRAAILKMERDLSTGDAGGTFANGEGNDSSVIGVAPSTNPEWFKTKNVKKFDKEHGTDFYKVVSKNIINRTLGKIRSGEKLTATEDKAWRYMQIAAKDVAENDTEVVAENAYTALEKEGFEFDKPENVPAGSIKPGDQVVIQNKGVPDKLTHKGFDEQGNAILQDGVTMHVDPFEGLEVIAKKQGARELNDADEQRILGLISRIKESATIEDVQRMKGEVDPYFKKYPQFEPYRKMVVGALATAEENLGVKSDRTIPANASVNGRTDTGVADSGRQRNGELNADQRNTEIPTGNREVAAGSAGVAEGVGVAEEQPAANTAKSIFANNSVATSGPVAQPGLGPASTKGNVVATAENQSTRNIPITEIEAAHGRAVSSVIRKARADGNNDITITEAKAISNQPKPVVAENATSTNEASNGQEEGQGRNEGLLEETVNNTSDASVANASSAPSEVTYLQKIEDEVYSRKPKPLPKSKRGDLAAISEYEKRYQEWRAEYKSAVKNNPANSNRQVSTDGIATVKESLTVQPTADEAKKVGTSKQPWEMITAKEYARSVFKNVGLKGKITDEELARFGAEHVRLIKNAIAEGKPVPDAVLANYRFNDFAKEEIAKRKSNRQISTDGAEVGANQPPAKSAPPSATQQQVEVDVNGLPEVEQQEYKEKFARQYEAAKSWANRQIKEYGKEEARKRVDVFKDKKGLGAEWHRGAKSAFEFNPLEVLTKGPSQEDINSQIEDTKKEISDIKSESLYKEAKAAIKKAEQQIAASQRTIDDWSSRVYKKTKLEYQKRDNGPFDPGYGSVSAANERRRARVIDQANLAIEQENEVIKRNNELIANSERKIKDLENNLKRLNEWTPEKHQKEQDDYLNYLTEGNQPTEKSATTEQSSTVADYTDEELKSIPVKFTKGFMDAVPETNAKHALEIIDEDLAIYEQIKKAGCLK